MRIEDKLFLVRFQPDTHSHIRLIDPDRCYECEKRPCTYVCPAKVYQWDERERKIKIAYEGCLECGTCMYADPYDNIDWKNPRGGFGVMYKFG